MKKMEIILLRQINPMPQTIREAPRLPFSEDKKRYEFPAPEDWGRLDGWAIVERNRFVRKTRIYPSRHIITGDTVRIDFMED